MYMTEELQATAQIVGCNAQRTPRCLPNCIFDATWNTVSYVDRMKKALDHFSDKCTYCTLHNKQSDKHEIIHCPLLPNILAYIYWRNNIKYKKPHTKICYFCHVPQCNDKLHKTFTSNGQSCNYPDIVAPLAYAIYHINSYKKLAQTHFKQQWPTEAIFTEWLTSKPLQGQKSNMTALLLWYFECT
jgi:hypothetical protein